MSIQSQIARISGAVSEQGTLLDQALAAIQNKAASGSNGSNSGPYSYAEEFIWTAPAEIKDDGTVRIPHSLGVEPDGANIVALETEFGSLEDQITSNIVSDRSMLYAGAFPFAIRIGFGAELGQTSIGIAVFQDVSQKFTRDSIIFDFINITGTQKIPAGKQYRVLVYKR